MEDLKLAESLDAVDKCLEDVTSILKRHNCYGKFITKLVLGVLTYLSIHARPFFSESDYFDKNNTIFINEMVYGLLTKKVAFECWQEINELVKVYSPKDFLIAFDNAEMPKKQEKILEVERIEDFLSQYKFF